MILQSKNIWLQDAFQPAQLKVEEKYIIDILPYGYEKVDFEYNEQYILPGFIDIHDHGYGGLDANHATEDFLSNWALYLCSEGITTFLPTTSTASRNTIESAYKVIGEYMEKPHIGAKIHGIHAEGPMISTEYKGAHNPSFLVKPEVSTLKHWENLSKNNIKMITIAPENDENFNVIKYCKEHGIIVSIGHSGATYEICKQAIHNGALSFTHTFNGMSGLHHRCPGVAAAAMDLSNAFAEIIVDGVHVDFNMVRIFSEAKKANKLILITDSIFAKGLKPGIYYREDKGCNLIVDENYVARLENGGLAGSTNKLNNMVFNLICLAGISLKTAIRAVTSTPAELLGINNKIGSLKIGLTADITITTSQFEIIETYVDGVLIYKAR